MSNSQIIRNETVEIKGIEYNQFPSPSSLIKATENKWALQLRDEGHLRLHSVEFYQSIEDTELGDTNEGKGMFKINSHTMETDSVNEVFIYCCSNPAASPRILKNFKPSYDTIIRILDLEEFVKRIISTAKADGYTFHPHLGYVEYNRGEIVTKKDLNNQKWHYNIFQKSPRYAHHREYRLSFSNISFRRIDNKCLDLILGNCRDIMKIET